jgi:hypothetical protein
VCKRFSKSFVYYLGAHEGCGFRYETFEQLQALWSREQDLREAVDENELGRESVRCLREYLTAAVEQGTVELYAVWAGDEAREPTQRLEVTPSYFSGDEFDFDVSRERRFFIVRKDREGPT